MKRSLAALVPSIGISLLVGVAITATPTTAHAEEPVPLPACSEPTFSACDSKSGGDVCSLDGGAGTCQTDSCFPVDGGASNGLRCVTIAEHLACTTQELLDLCEGKDNFAICNAEGWRCGPILCDDGRDVPGLTCRPTGGEGGVLPVTKEGGSDARNDDASPLEQGSGASGPTNAATNAPSSEDGCSCRTAGASSSPLGPMTALLAAAAFFVARSRKRAR